MLCTCRNENTFLVEIASSAKRGPSDARIRYNIRNLSYFFCNYNVQNILIVWKENPPFF